MENTIYLITGAGGHLGSTITRMLARRGAQVRGLVLPDDPCPALHGLSITLVRGDVRDRRSLIPLFDNPERRRLVVIHAAGLVSIAAKAPRTLYEVNVTGTRNIIACCQRFGVEKLVYVSSVHAIPEHAGIIREVSGFSPSEVHGAYAQTKAAATRAVLEAAATGLDASVVHPSGIIGPGDYGSAHLTQLILDYVSGRLRACVSGGYDFADVRDVAAGTLACAERGAPGECYILSGHYASVRALLDMLQRVSGARPVLVTLPMGIARLTAPLAELYYKLLHQTPLYTSYSLYTLRTNAVFSHQKAEQQLGYRPRPLIVTLADTCEWLRRAGRV